MIAEGHTRQVGILVFDEVEVLDMAGPFEVFSVASRLMLRQRPAEPPPFGVALVSADGGTVRARGGLRLTPDRSITDAPPFDIVVVPGGIVDAPERDPIVTSWVQERWTSSAVVASICTGAFVLAAAGLLDGLKVTTHREDQAVLARRYPAVRVVGDRRWVDHGRIATSGGISAGIDLSLHLVGRFLGTGHARATAHQMEYDGRESPAG